MVEYIRDLNHYFEAGILTDDSTIVELAMDQFGSVWNGSMCKKYPSSG